MRVTVRGSGFLADTTRTACQEVGHTLVTKDGPTDVLWICHHLETPDTTTFFAHVYDDIDVCDPSRTTPILISAPIPVGTTALLEQRYPGCLFAYSPENIRRDRPLIDFLTQTRIVVGRRTEQFDTRWNDLLSPFTGCLIFTNPETAEMAKHALNAYLALSIVFANEIARLAEQVGVNADIIAQTLLTERRISPHAPLHPGLPYGGGHLARDLAVLTTLASRHGVNIPVLAHIYQSNEEERCRSERSSQAHQDLSVNISSSDSLPTAGPSLPMIQLEARTSATRCDSKKV